MTLGHFFEGSYPDVTISHSTPYNAPITSRNTKKPSQTLIQPTTLTKMSIRHVETAPKAEDFTPLQEHQEQTPTTFFGAKPVTYANYSGVTLSAPASQLQQDPVFAKFSTTTDGDDTLIEHVDIWVASE